MCALLCYLHSGKNANLFPCILGNFEKKSETNFTILREHLCMLHYSSMPAIEHSPIEKNKKSQYVRTVCTTCIKLKDKKSLFVHKFTFLCIFLTHIWMWNLTRYAVHVFKRQSTVMMLCEQYNIRGVKSYLNEDYLAFMQMLLHIFFISLWKQSKASFLCAFFWCQTVAMMGELSIPN